jgi:hypothetical protein
MYHVELRQFPHSAWRFNLSEAQLEELAESWVRSQPLEVGERRWDPQKARLRILSGPELGLGELSMGRGWRAAERPGEDVTARVLRATGERLGAAPGAGGPGSRPTAAALTEAPALGEQIDALLGPDALALLEAWREVASGEQELRPSEALARAEAQLRRRAGKTRG